jgi:hypothetical protein
VALSVGGSGLWRQREEEDKKEGFGKKEISGWIGKKE